jgi:hypothetical protein
MTTTEKILIGGVAAFLGYEVWKHFKHRHHHGYLPGSALPYAHERGVYRHTHLR